MYVSQIWATSFLRQGRKMDNPIQKWLVTLLKMMLGVRDTTPSWCIMQLCKSVACWIPCRPVYPMQQLHNEKSFASWHAIDLQSPDGWSSHSLSAMEGLTQSYMFKQELFLCVCVCVCVCVCAEPIDLSRLVVDLRDRHLEFWAHFLMATQKNATVKRWLITGGALLPAQRALVITHSPHKLPITGSLTFLEMWFAVCLVSDFVFTPFETAIWNSTSFATCD
jgi:hypothetical protein